MSPLTTLHELSALLRRGVLHGQRHGWKSSLSRAAALLTDRRFPEAGSYDNWVACCTPTLGPAQGPAVDLLVSVIVPVKDPPAGLLTALARSVLTQDHARLELVLVDDDCRNSAVLAELQALALGDGRVHLVAAGRVGISAATNRGAQCSRGEVLAFADHDDLLASGVLGVLARAYAADPTLDLAYTDEDMLDERGRRVCPSYRPGPSPWLALGFNTGAHLLSVRRGLFESLGGLRSEFDGAQDHDLLLRALECARRTLHIPMIGYHWRRVPGSVAHTSTAKPWAYAAGQRAVASAVARRGLRLTSPEPTSVPGVLRLDPVPAQRRPRARVLLHGPAGTRAAWQRWRPGGLQLEVLTDDRWPAPDEGAPLLVIASACRPDEWALRRLLAWLEQPGLQAVAGVASCRRRLLDLGHALDRDGLVRAVLPGLREGAVGPSLLAAAPREVAAGGLHVLALSPGALSPLLAGQRACAWDLLALTATAAARGAPTLLDPRARLAVGAALGPTPVAQSLASHALWPSLADGLPFTEQGTDVWCPRVELLEPLGVPGPR